MKKSERTEMIKKLTESLDESMDVYETAQMHGKPHPWAGCDIPLHDSRDSMLRRIRCIREQLTVLAKQLREET